MKDIEFDPITYNILKNEFKKKVILGVYFKGESTVDVKNKVSRTKDEKDQEIYRTWVYNPKTGRYNRKLEFAQNNEGKWEAWLYIYGSKPETSKAIFMKIRDD